MPAAGSDLLIVERSGTLYKAAASEVAALGPRVNSQASASSITPDIGAYDAYELSALATNLTVNNPTGTGANLAEFRLVIASDDSGHSIAWGDGYIGDLPTSIAAYDVKELVFYYHAGEDALLLRSSSTQNFNPLDADALAYINAMSVAPDATRQGHINTLVEGLKEDGVWAKLDWLSLFAAHDRQAARLNLINPAQTFVEVGGAPTFTADTGYRSVSNRYLDSQWSPANEGDNLTLNSAFIGAWCLTNAANTSGFGITNSLAIYPRYNASTAYGYTNTSSANTVTVATSAGYMAADRASASRVDYIVNGSIVDTDTGNAAISLSTSDIRALSDGSTFDTGRTYAAQFWGGHLTEAEHTALYNRLSTYLTAVGAI